MGNHALLGLLAGQRALPDDRTEGDVGRGADATGGAEAASADGAPSGWGTPLASHHGVTAYRNSDAGFSEYGARGEFGLMYQCVEYVNRFASRVLGVANMSGTGNASAYAGERAGMAWVPNKAGPTLPEDGDILVFSGGSFGHVAICTGSSAGAVEMIQQNTSSALGSLGVSGEEGSLVVGAFSGMPLLGWLHTGQAPPESELVEGIGTEDEGSRSGEQAVYVVQNGDSLWSIAEAHFGDGSRYTDIAAWNSITPPYTIHSSDMLVLQEGGETESSGVAEVAAPSAQETYLVQAGDTLWAIAQRFLGDGERYPEIASANAIQNPNAISVGQELVIPGAGGSTVEQPESSESLESEAVEEASPAEEESEQEERGSAVAIQMKRKEIDIFADEDEGEDKYGHWWTEMGDESYGWWPKYGVSIKETFLGVDGELNGQTTFGGTPSKDPHHGDSADNSFEVEARDKDKTPAETQQEVRDFANGYSGKWQWVFGAGQNCHTFQKEMMNKVGLEDKSSSGTER